MDISRKRTIKFGEVQVGETARRNVLHCLDTNQLTMGPKVEKLEQGWAKVEGSKYCTMTSSGTTADMAALMALYDLGAKPGDEVICPALTFIATANAIRAAGFKPVFVDIRKDTLNIDESLIEEKITDKTRAIIATNTMGKPCKMDKLREIANKNKLMLVSDSCESHLCKYQNYSIQEYADICTYSLFAAHILFAVEGSFVTTNKKDIDDIIKSIRSHGRLPNSLYFDHIRFGLNFKPTDLHASIGLESLDKIHETFSVRKNNYNKINNFLNNYNKLVYLSQEDDGDINAPHGISISAKEYMFDIKDLCKHLDNYTIQWKRNFGCVPTQHKAFAYLQDGGNYPNAEYIGNNGIHIGVHQYLSECDIQYIIDVLKEFFDEYD